MKTGKVWGSSESIKANSSFELHRIEIKQGAFCSKHAHQHKYNGFFVEAGILRIKTWKNDYDLVDVTEISSGQYTEVAPGEFHQFEAITDVIAFEVYWAEFKHDDIIRETVGGISE